MSKYATALLLALGVLVMLAPGAHGAVLRLTNDQEVAAVRLASQESKFQNLVVPRAYETSSVVPWYYASPEKGLIGGVVTFHLAMPATIDGTWPLLHYDTQSNDPRPFGAVSFQMTIADLSDIDVFVDLSAASVIAVQPHGDDGRILTAPPGFARARSNEHALAGSPPLVSTPFESKAVVADDLLTPMMPPPDEGGSAVQAIYVNGNRQFYNWDFTEQTATYQYADWPVTLVFGNAANIDKVKDNLTVKYDQGGTCADPMNNRVGPNYASMIWDTDEGRKDTCCPITGGATHFRLYADHDDSPDRLYAPAFGYYVVGTSHRDIRECGGSTEYGFSEDAEYEIATDSGNWAGWGVYYDATDLHNAVVTSWIGNRYYQNDGWASYISAW